MKLRAQLRATGGTTTGFQIPDSFVDELGGGGRPKVAVTINGVTLRTSIARMGGQYLLGVSAANRAATGIQAGDTLDLEIVLDAAPREVVVPDDLAAALAADEQAAAFWATLSYSAQRWHVEHATGAKTEQTRAKRVARSIELLREGRAR
jgi:hypothetical protein